MKKYPLTVSFTLFGVLGNMMVWLVFGMLVAAGLIPGFPDLPIIVALIVVASLTIAGTHAFLFIFLRRRNRIAYFIALGLFSLSCTVTFLDEVGIMDLLFLASNLIPLILLLCDRRWYLQSGKEVAGRLS